SSPPPDRRRLAAFLIAGALGVAIVVIGAVAAFRQPRGEPAAEAPAAEAPAGPRAAVPAPAAPPPAAVTPPAVAPVEQEAPRTLSVENPTRTEGPSTGERPRAASKNLSKNPSAPAKPAPARHRPAEKAP